MVDLQISGCTNIESTKQGQVLGTGDKVYFRGGSSSGNSINAHSITCVWFIQQKDYYPNYHNIER